MKTKYSSKNKNEPIRGWSIADQRLLRELDPARNPRTQIFAYSEPDSDDEEKPQETIIKYCDKCENYNLRFFDLLHCWYCYSCGNKVQNEPFRRKPPQEIFMASAQQGPYPVYNEDDPTIPFMESINLNKDLERKDNPNIQLIRESQNGRIRHYKVTNSEGITAALSAMSEAERE